MASSRNSGLQQGYLVLLVLAFTTLVSTIDVNVCASFNTAQTPLNVSIYQTNGLCGGFCTRKNYAFSITQQNSCWCSNYYPDQASVVDTKKCNVPCPAWQPEYCGGPGLFGYILLNEVAPSGTSTAPASSTTAQEDWTHTSSAWPPLFVTPLLLSKACSSEKPDGFGTDPLGFQTNVVIVTNRVTKTGAEHNVNNVLNNVQLHNCFHRRVHFHLGVLLHLLFHTRDSSSTTSSSSSASTTPPPSSASSGGQSSSGSGSGSSGLPQQTADPSGDQSGTTSKKSKSGISSGAIAGIVVGVVGGLALIAAALFFWLRRRRQNKDEYRDDPSVRGSSSGMVGSVPPEMSVNGGSPASPVSAANRNSTIQIDPRMDPFKQGLYIRGSHESLNTLRDDHDYSRRIQRPPVLRATNPDPEEA
ncbi:hypothetical protein MKX08_005662 [Trichoderma sp. CBMAI-0020]|nr:hypothetical protein MKX08_005662 [Trichoderma sp. CBMAI-0020]